MKQKGGGREELVQFSDHVVKMDERGKKQVAVP